MKIKNIFFLLSLVFAVSVISSVAYTASKSGVEYPIAELDNCSSQDACKDYCDVTENVETCLKYAELYGLMSKDQIAEATKMLKYVKSGETPGKCRTETECKNYCDSPGNINECVDFALKMGEITADEAARVKKTGGVGPGNCKSKEACNSYCNDDSHLTECVQFAVDNGMVDPREAEFVIKTGGKGPAGCSGTNNCKQYCDSHLSECLSFAVEHGIMTAKEAEAVANSGDDQTRRTWCNANDENFETCAELQLKYGVADEQEITHQRILYYESPGECKGDGSCLNSYCTSDDEGKMNECWQWDVKIGDKTQQEYDQWKIDFQKMKDDARRAAEAEDATRSQSTSGSSSSPDEGSVIESSE